MVVQLVTHIPFIYYISKEQLMMIYDEYYNSSISNMIERVIFESGDPRFYLAEFKANVSSEKTVSRYEGYVFLHRLPHMRLPKKVKQKLNYMLYICFILSSVLSTQFDSYFEMCYGCYTTVLFSMDLMIIPGLFYYFKSK